MSVRLDRIVPWGRSMREYEWMFDLSADDLGRSILGCGDGPASFNAEMTKLGRRVVSVDPGYVFGAAEIERRFEESAAEVLSQVSRRPENYVWSYHRDVEDLRRNRVAVMRAFVEDYDRGRRAGRYVPASLPRLPFADGAFGLALCSHLLFLYSGLLSADFHVGSIIELVRVAGEARVFPLVGLDCAPSPHLGEVTRRLSDAGYAVEVREVRYQLQRNGNRMMRVRKRG